MADEKDAKLDGFKIGDSHRPGMSAPAKRAGQADESVSQSVGFGRIEELLEKEDPVEVGQSLNRLLKELEAFGESASTNRDKAAAKKATAAVERAVDLMDYLFQTKAEMQSNPS